MTKSQLVSREDQEEFSAIAERLHKIEYQIGEACAKCGRDRNEITVMAVTKTVAPKYINFAVEQGITLLGENRAQELTEKYDDYILKQENIHFIGHLQTNKVRQIIDKVCLIQSVDSLRLAQEIDRQAEKRDRIMDVLLEVNIGQEESKSGIPAGEALPLAESVLQLSHLRLRGLMAIPTVEHPERDFANMEELFHQMKAKFSDSASMDILSLGMSGDYPLAVEHGSTLVRLGSAIFGPRKPVLP